MRDRWDYALSELAGGSSDPGAGRLANEIEAHVSEIVHQRDDLAMLLRLALYRHGKQLPLDKLLERAADYLKRKKLEGSPLRIDANVSTPEGEPQNSASGEK